MKKFVNFYRKYRPKTFNEIKGQSIIIQILRHQIQSKNIHHAYLFSGKQGIGKTSTARIFAKTINCQNLTPETERCFNCKWCLEIERQTIDIHEIDAASNNSVENIRTLKDNVSLSPFLGQFKIYIIDEVHMLSRSAFNAFLKMLEEPPRHVIFILATTEPEKIPTTIISRCQHFNFVSLNVTTLENFLNEISEQEKIMIDKAALNLIAVTTKGAVREALNLLEQTVAYFPSGKLIDLSMLKNFFGTFQKEQILILLEHIFDHNYKIIWNIVDNLNHQNTDFLLLTQQMISLCNNLQILAQKNHAEFIQKYHYFKNWSEKQLTLLNQISQTLLKNLHFFQLTTPSQKIVFEHLIMTIIILQPSISYNQQYKFLQILKNNKKSFKEQLKIKWSKIQKNDVNLEFWNCFSQVKLLAISDHEILFLGQKSEIIDLQTKHQQSLKSFLKTYQLENHQATFITFKERDFLKSNI